MIYDAIARIDENPDILHADHTPAVRELVQFGRPALPALLEVMVCAENDLTRLRAQRAIEGITLKEMGFQAGQGWQGENRENEWLAQWRALGNLDWEGTQAERERSVALWREWLMSDEEPETE